MHLLLLGLILFLFLPLPVSITLQYTNNMIAVYIYHIKLPLNKKKHKKYIKSKRTIRNLKDKYNFDLKRFIRILRNTKFKPFLFQNLQLSYGFEDCAYTGLFYGIISSVAAFMPPIISILFNLKKYKFNIYPDFTNKILIFKSKSIILVSIANVIYILIFISLCTKKISLRRHS